MPQAQVREEKARARLYGLGLPVRLEDAAAVAEDGVTFHIAAAPWSRLPWHPALRMNGMPDLPRQVNRLNGIVRFDAPPMLPVRLSVPVVPLILVAVAQYAWYTLSSAISPVTRATGTAWQTHSRNVAGLLGKLRFDKRHLGYLGQVALLECYHPSGSIDMRAWVSADTADLQGVLRGDTDLAWSGVRDVDGNILTFY